MDQLTDAECNSSTWGFLTYEVNEYIATLSWSQISYGLQVIKDVSSELVDLEKSESSYGLASFFRIDLTKQFL